MGQGPTLRTSFNLTTTPPRPETPSPNAVTLGFRASTHGLGGGETQFSLLHRALQSWDTFGDYRWLTRL